MITQLIFVESAKLYIALATNGKIFQIQKSTNPQINPHAIRVDELDATTERTNVHVADRNVYGDRSKLYLDAADIVTFAAWLHSELPNASTKAFGKAMFGYFPGSQYFKEVLTAAGQLVCAPELKRPPQGDEHFYIDKAKAIDPDGWAELVAEYAASIAPKSVQ
ncbi:MULTISPECIES: hypothetical protein [unclassified Mesorhizobium]|uniref:hypothetical protein n=1 Tax=unclassified Mesorhizobium TaxID=325217 RepID=UPI00112E2388|nr:MULTISPECIES: hypothetical protein [unclassified Mesorhizobium]TPI56166.1 hypothetical protein FJW11_00520 [Mesorhizobium sp. B3-1-1]TPJ70516.1 hypothetical protein FJ462_07450 [Mesorhizobium sp. B2-6-7]TPJ89291.1 hypothetical protein FJ422_05360 [Mesorhizobium sp. B2-6-3]TPK04372.1 hypothetical protein FJ491_05360 [Mesorhizobium sp. B2-5-10]TPK14812.1 hypothetical protein FJ490_05755 [Mesorhizobium sp. B2-5-11]